VGANAATFSGARGALAPGDVLQLIVLGSVGQKVSELAVTILAQWT
jgi:hypothetical protein